LSLPKDGILELDFVQISKAAVHHKPISNAELHLLCEHEWLDRQDGAQLVQILRTWTNTHYFSCAQVTALIGMIKVRAPSQRGPLPF